MKIKFQDQEAQQYYEYLEQNKTKIRDNNLEIMLSNLYEDILFLYNDLLEIDEMLKNEESNS